ncbi:cytosolic protein [Lentibacillus sp. N15]|uniref:cytosolic protein n=1 Tax=Lentibacillus songyuanensis TaxID=3136161 RepID=UPI0031B9C601
MSVKQAFMKYFSNHAETGENHWDPALRTHYYKLTKDNGLKKIEAFFNHSDTYEVNAISNEHGEISVHVTKGRKAFVIITVIMVRPYRTAIDFAVTSESFLPFDFGYSSSLIQRLYHEFDNTFPLID